MRSLTLVAALIASSLTASCGASVDREALASLQDKPAPRVDRIPASLKRPCRKPVNLPNGTTFSGLIRASQTDRANLRRCGAGKAALVRAINEKEATK